jgi:hypothetical protein
VISVYSSRLCCLVGHGSVDLFFYTYYENSRSDFHRWVRIKENHTEDEEPDLDHPFVDSRHAHQDQRVVEVLANRSESGPIICVMLMRHRIISTYCAAGNNHDFVSCSGN